MSIVNVQMPRRYSDGGQPALSAIVDVAGQRREVFWRTQQAPLSDGADTLLAAALLPAMKLGVPLRLPLPVSARLLDAMPRYQEIMCAWYKDLEPVQIQAERRTHNPYSAAQDVGCFFSGGVDSSYSVQAHVAEIDRLIFIHGFDVPLEKTELRQTVVAGVRAAAAEYGKLLLEVETNIRSLLDPYCDWLQQSHGAALASVALLLSPGLRKTYVAASMEYDHMIPLGSHPLLDPLWSTETLDVVYDGAATPTQEKIDRMAQNKTMLRWLRVCWENTRDAYNCGACYKCARMMVHLHAAGVLQQCATLPHTIDLDVIRRQPATRGSVYYIEERLRVVQARLDEPALEQALRESLRRGGYLPKDEQPATTPLPAFFARPETVRKLEDASAAKTLLLGGFVGGWNFGDLLQLRGALRWGRERAPAAALCPLHVLEMASDRAYLQRLERAFDVRDWIFVNLYAGGHIKAADLGLEQIRTEIRGPCNLHVYGGGFFNHMWGEMSLSVIEGLLARAAPLRYFMSGQQVGADFAPRLAQHCHTYRPDLVGCRDAASAALMQQHGVEAQLSGDDAFEEMDRAVADAPMTDPPAQQNSFALHVNTSSYVTGTGQPHEQPPIGAINQMLATVSDYLGPAARPLLLKAYETSDPSVRDTLVVIQALDLPSLFAPPQTLDLVALFEQDQLAQAAQRLRPCRLGLATSYHVALFLQRLGIPTYLLVLNSYYRQKKGGLGEGTESLASFLTGALDGIRGRQARRVEERRQVRRQWLARLRDAQDRPANAQNVQQRAIVALQRQRLSRQDAATTKLQEQLDLVLSSSTWRLTEPVRTAARRLRRRRSG